MSAFHAIFEGTQTRSAFAFARLRSAHPDR